MNKIIIISTTLQVLTVMKKWITDYDTQKIKTSRTLFCLQLSFFNTSIVNIQVPLFFIFSHKGLYLSKDSCFLIKQILWYFFKLWADKMWWWTGWDGIFGYLTSHEAYCLCEGNHSGHNLHTRGWGDMKMKGQPNRDTNPVPPSQWRNHATDWANEAGSRSQHPQV